MRGRRRGGPDHGFTLIELLIVIMILGVLAAIVVFAVGRSRHDSAVASCKHDVRSVETSAESVRVQTSAYPPDPDALLVAPGNLLKTWPSTDAYGIDWNGSEVEVYDGPGAGANFTGNGLAGCDNLDSAPATTAVTGPVTTTTAPPVRHGRGHHYGHP